MEFSALSATDELADRYAHVDPDNPFLSPSYVRAQQQLGLECWLLALEESGTERAVAVALIRSGRIRRSLTIPSCPDIPPESPFWKGVEAFCRAQGITDLEISTFASAKTSIPPIKGETGRIQRTEFELPLPGRDLYRELSHHHRERVKKARKRGVVLRRTRSADALREHIVLRQNSMTRRKARGEHVPPHLDDIDAKALLASGAGELFQGILEEKILSSLLILRSERGAYFESAGNSPEGMHIGASHFVVLETATTLQAEGFETFFLGGARPHEEGLIAYKSGFGPVSVPTELVVAYVGSRIRHRLSSIAEAVQHVLKPDIAD
jgi:GNAT acetyltransferase-like protein